MNDLRSLLHQLADRITVAMESPPAADASGAGAHDDARRAALVEALRAFAEGDLSLARAGAAPGTPEGEALTAGVRRVRDLVAAGRAVVGAGTGRVDEVRAAAERAADGASRQRVSLERAGEQMRQLVQRSQELAAAADEIGELSDRASLLALNTGIEGLRVGGEVARALGALGEELRKLSQRAASSARELAAGLGAAGEQARAAAGAVDEARAAARVAADEATRAATAADGVRRADAALATALEGFRLLDDETEALVARLDADADRLARDVASARARLEGADPAALGAIREALSRVARAAGGPAPGDDGAKRA